LRYGTDVYAHADTCVCNTFLNMHVFIQVYTHTHKVVYTYIRIYSCSNIFVDLCVRIDIYRQHLQKSEYAYMHSDKNMYMYIHTHIKYTYIHTSIHTHRHREYTLTHTRICVYAHTDEYI